MKLVVLAGGLGTRISEETAVRPKPMIEVGGKPLLWHIFKIYSHYGIKEFIVCCGFKGYVIKEYFSNYFLHNSDVTIDVTSSKVELHNQKGEDWKISLIDTGELTMTGGRLKRIQHLVAGETFCATYGDGLSNVNIEELIRHHKQTKRLATLTAVRPPARFGRLILGDSYKVSSFEEKPPGDGDWINGGFFVLEPQALDYINGDNCLWEQSPLSNLAKNNQLTYYLHDDFWQPIDTLRDKNYVEELWQSSAPWKVWL